MKYVYIAVFTPEPSKTNKNLLSVRFPDLLDYTSGTCGDNLQDAIYMAKDLLCMCLYQMERDGNTVPTATSPQDIKIADGEFISAIDVDTEFYRRLNANKAVRKTLTIPSWLNTEAEKAHVNFSSVLQSALKEHLKVAEPVGK
ncbi:MAG: type II toxin-antitoxin system HicB family antitoxin [Dehalococcoidia bacterium]|nr:type II toxin-antitoxin system HicB family antitoxin [Dehalococcoidia bacterium]